MCRMLWLTAGLKRPMSALEELEQLPPDGDLTETQRTARDRIAGQANETAGDGLELE